MSQDKLKLPKRITSAPSSGGVSDRVRTEMLKTQRADLEGAAKVDVARLQVMQEGLSLAKSVCELLKSNNSLKATVVEWEGRVRAEEIAVQKAIVELETAREQNKTRADELAQARAAQDRILALFDQLMKETVDVELPAEDRRELRQNLLTLSNHLVPLRK